MGMIIDVTRDNFRNEIIERSMNENVVVDFWAPWCAPCKQITPILEKLSEELNFTLCKVNTETEQELAAAMRISSIPDIRVIGGGRIVDQFQGAVSEAELRARLAPHFKHPLELAYDEAKLMRQEGNTEIALNLIDQILEHDPKHKKAWLEKAQCLLALGDKEQAKAILESFQTLDDGYSQAQSILKLMGFATQLSAEPSNHPLDALYRSGLQAALNEDWENAMKIFLEVFKSDRSFNNDAGREALITLFQTLATTEADLVKKYRQRLSMYLFS